MPFTPFEREQQGKSLVLSLVIQLPHGNPALFKSGATLDQAEKHRLMAEADGYLRRAEEIRRTYAVQRRSTQSRRYFLKGQMRVEILHRALAGCPLMAQSDNQVAAHMSPFRGKADNRSAVCVENRSE
jgi:hypothetical protein